MKESVITVTTQANTEGLPTVSVIQDTRHPKKILCSFTIDQTNIKYLIILIDCVRFMASS